EVGGVPGAVRVLLAGDRLVGVGGRREFPERLGVPVVCLLAGDHPYAGVREGLGGGREGVLFGALVAGALRDVRELASGGGRDQGLDGLGVLIDYPDSLRVSRRVRRCAITGIDPRARWMVVRG